MPSKESLEATGRQAMSEVTYTDLRLANYEKHLRPCEEIAVTLLENNQDSHDFKLLLDNTRRLLLQVAAFRKKHEGERP